MTTSLQGRLEGELLSIFEDQPKIVRAILFGSRARGDADERSDVDLAIQAPNASQREWLDITFKLEESDTLLHIDVVRWEEASAGLKKRISVEGKVLYEKKETKPEPAQSRGSVGKTSGASSRT